ncbi:helix-turn-helix transcriptional regulator [Mucilaginibacter sp. 21P]|nr:helix-turn-helix transcriptional regulator [Mucilaginibacter sp. 21P]
MINRYRINEMGISADVLEIFFSDIVIRYSVASLPFDLAVNADGVEPTVQMHFGLSGHEQSYLNGQVSLSILEGQHNLFFVNAGSEELLVMERNRRFITFEVNFRPDHFHGLLKATYMPFQHFAEAMAEQRSVLLGRQSLPVTFEMRRVIENIIKCDLPDHLLEFYLQSKVNELFALQLQQFGGGPGLISSVRLHASDVEILTTIKRDMDSTLVLPHSLEGLAYIHGINTDKLKKGFKQLFGHTVFGYLRHVRLEQARLYLLQKDRTIAEIAALSGYKNPQHFSKVYKAHYGVLPRETTGQ